MGSTAAETIVVIGAGQAGFQLAASLRQSQYHGRIILFGDEQELPYQRPPLSKGYFKDGRLERLLFRNADFFAKNNIELQLGVRVSAIERDTKHVVLSDGTRQHYDHLVLATGARNRTPPLDGVHLPGVTGLRSVKDAEMIRRQATRSRKIVVIGGGFIGLEAASVFRESGCDVTVLEAGTRLMARAVTPATSEFFLQAHREAGTDIRLNVTARGIVAGPDGHVGAVELADGTLLDADLVILGTGVTPNDELARQAGIKVDNGIVTDAFLSTSDRSISAIGDCANVWHDSPGSHLRLESVQAAVDQAKCLAERLTGKPRPYRKAPWFWSDQGAHKLQIAGLSIGADHFETSGSAREGRLVVRAYRGNQLICVETVNAPAEHMQARRSLDERMLTQDSQLLNVPVQ